MREVAYAEELEHYVSRVEFYKQEVEKTTEELTLRRAKLEVLNDVLKSVESGPGQLLLSEDIKAAQEEITDLQKHLSHSRGNLKAFESIVEAFNS